MNVRESGNDMLVKWTNIVVISALVYYQGDTSLCLANCTILFFFSRIKSFIINTAFGKMTHCRINSNIILCQRVIIFFLIDYTMTII